MKIDANVILNSLADDVDTIISQTKNAIMDFLRDVYDFISGKKSFGPLDVLTSPIECLKEMILYLKTNFIKYSKALIIIGEVIALSSFTIMLNNTIKTYESLKFFAKADDLVFVKKFFTCIAANMITTQLLSVLEAKKYALTAHDKNSVFGGALKELSDLKKRLYKEAKKGLWAFLSFKTLKMFLELLIFQYKIQFRLAKEDKVYATILFLDYVSAGILWYVLLTFLYKRRAIYINKSGELKK